MNNIFINTLTFVDKYEAPINQLSIVKELINGGLKNIEIRREFLSDSREELSEISELAKKNNVTLYYSIPDTLYKKFKLDTKNLTKYLEESKLLGSKTIKLSVGSYSGYNNGDDLFIKGLLKSGIKLYVENDQTLENGSVKKIKKFLDDCKTNNNDVKATFDVGNWLWVGEDPKECAEILKEYIDYVHFKDVEIVNGKYQAAKLGEGIIDWKYFRDLFKNKTVGLEYSCGKNTINVLEEEIKKLN